MKRSEIERHVASTFPGFADKDLPAGTRLARGKVRDIVDLGDRLLIVTTDRISAFDRVLAEIPFKGEVLNRLSAYWFEETEDILANHVIETVGARSMIVRKGQVIPIEVVVRGYLTGSAWRDYQSGRPISGVKLPPGMKLNQRFAEPLLTPSTKEEQGKHDEPISVDEIVARGRVSADLWRKIDRAAKALFQRGTELSARRNLILVDTKYEFALIEGELVVVDEMHTPDSSRYWYAESYEELFAAGEDQRKIDKEYLRQWLMERGFSGNGEPPAIPDDVRAEVAWRYIQAFELITGAPFVPSGADVGTEKRQLLARMV